MELKIGSGSYEKQQSVWLGDLCDEVRRVELKRGDTMQVDLWIKLMLGSYLLVIFTQL